MKIVVTFFGIMFMLGCVETTANPESNGYYALFDYFFEFQENLNSDIDYLAVDLSNFNGQHRENLSEYIGSFCQKNGITFLDSTYQQLVIDGYIDENGWIENGILFLFSEVSVTADRIVCEGEKFRGILSGVGTTLTAEFTDGTWTVSSEGFWIS